IAALNHRATRDLREGSMASCIAHLREAEALAASVSDTSFHAMTLNNMASYHRAMDRPHMAMRFLVRALRLEMACQGPTADLSVAGTHLNISSVLSHLGRHHQSLRHAQGALKLLNARSASPVGEADEVSLAGLSSRSDALDADGPPAAVLLPLDEHLDDGELFFPRDVQDGYVSWAEPPSTRPMHHDKPPTADSLSSETVERILGSSSSETLRDDANDSSAFLTGVNLERERRGSQSHDQALEPGALENKASVLASVPVAGPRGRRPILLGYAVCPLLVFEGI
ncbi:hypothetical protein FOZ63_030982, partial [Perkinsus olseni]